MKKTHSLLMGVLVLGAAMLLSGCGGKSVKLEDYLIVDYIGYDTVGTAHAQFDVEKMIADNPEAFGIKGEASELEIASVEIALDGIGGSLDKSKELSNGDTVTWSWKIKNEEKLSEKFPVKFIYSDVKYTVDGLDEAETFDPFAGITVTFDGVAPNGRANIDASNKEISGLRYTADKTQGLKNGDIVTVKAEASGDLNEYCIKYGKLPTRAEAEYTVEGLSAYAMKLDEIPDDMKTKMLSQSEDIIRAYAAGWIEDNTLKELTHLGYYFLSVKDGFSSRTTNQLFCVYKGTARLGNAVTPEDHKTEIVGEEAFYTYVYFDNIMLLPDGNASVDLSAGQMTGNSFKSSKYGYMNWGYNSYSYKGFPDLDTMFNKCVTAQVSNYNYDNTVSG
ncbi:MAG: hypothetical protein K5876_02435 [Ruminiclostridium sp.]|nr:hypothetical protein [Ruminiclostridium sp.]